MPLLVCGGSDDVVIDQKLQTDWQPWLKPEDTLWQCPQGRYFFHYFQPEKVAHEISTFLQLKQSALTATV